MCIHPEKLELLSKEHWINNGRYWIPPEKLYLGQSESECVNEIVPISLKKFCFITDILTLHAYGSSFCQPNLPPTVESVMRVPNTVLAIVLWMKKFRAVTRRWRLRNGIMRKNSKQEDVMNVITAIDDYLWVEAGDEGPYDGATL